MSDENTFRPVYLKDRNFIEPGYERQLKQNSVSDSAARSSYNTFSLKENKGNIGNIDFQTYYYYLNIYYYKKLNFVRETQIYIYFSYSA